MDRITICDLEMFCRIGVTEAERTCPQRLLVTLEAEMDLSLPARTGQLADTCDYAAMAECLLQLGQSRSWVLVETLAADMASMVLDEFGAEHVFLEVKKFILPQARHVAVGVRRSRSASG